MRSRTDNDGHNPNTCEILKAISDKSILHIAVINKFQNRQQRHRKKQRPGQRTTTNPRPKVPESYRQCNSGDEIPPSQWIGNADIPKRIDDGQLRRPHQFTGIKPQGASSDERTFGE